MWKNKHIVIVGPAHPLRGGLATYNERLARELQLHNKVTLLTFSLQYPNFLFPGESQYSNDPVPQDLNIDIRLNSINPFNWISAGYAYKKIKPDVIIFRYWMPFFGPCFGTFARIVKSNGHTKMVAITDNIIPHEKHFYDKPCTNYFLGSIDKAVAMSKKVLHDLQTIFPQKAVAKNSSYHAHPLYDNFGEKLDRAEACKLLHLNPDKHYLLFFGFIRKYKGLDLLLESMSLLPNSYSNIELIVAGEVCEDSEPYLDIIRTHNLENRVHLHTKFISNDDVKVYFSASDVIAQPYRSATQSGVSQVAYHFEIPMIITNVGGLSELVPHKKAGLVCEPTPQEFSNAIVEIFEGQNIPQMKENLKELKKQFSWESMVNELSR